MCYTENIQKIQYINQAKSIISENDQFSKCQIISEINQRPKAEQD